MVTVPCHVVAQESVQDVLPPHLSCPSKTGTEHPSSMSTGRERRPSGDKGSEENMTRESKGRQSDR